MSGVAKLSNQTSMREIKRIFGPPPVLSTEDPQAYYDIIGCLLETERPEDFFGLLLIKQIADKIWEALRCQRHKILAVENASRKAGKEPTEQDQAQALRENVGHYALLTDIENRSIRLQNVTFELWRRYRPMFPIRGVESLERF